MKVVVAVVADRVIIKIYPLDGPTIFLADDFLVVVNASTPPTDDRNPNAQF
jgi:hypothetical protein